MKQYIKTVREHNAWRRGADIEMVNPRLLGYALDAVVKAAERYEFIRTLNIHELTELRKRNLSCAGNFDDLVDAMIEARK